MTLRAGPTSRRSSALLMLVGFVVLLVGANIMGGEVARTLNFDVRPSNEEMFHRTLMTVAVVYLVLIAIPFVPAVEIGLALLAIFGPPVAVVLYACTVAGLCMSFLLGRLIPLGVLGRLFDEINLRRACALMFRLEPLDENSRLSLLLQEAPGRIVPGLLRHRHLALAIALNLPGNVLIGGGGGIALSAGVSKLYSTRGFVLTVALAVAPLPLAVLAFGKEFLAM